MDVNNLATKIKHLHSDVTQQMAATSDKIMRREMEVYLLALDKVMELIKQAKDVARLEQQLARKRSLLEQDPKAEWSHLSGTDAASASGTDTTAPNVSKMPFAVHANNDRDDASGDDQIAA